MSRRVRDLLAGVAMVVTDLHGDGEAYGRYRDRFLDLRAQGLADRLILCGDLIHSEGPAHQDMSLPILRDVMRLQAELGPEGVIVLLGNHELAHVYSLPLSRGEIDYSPGFERKLAEAGPESRLKVVDFLTELPFFVRTAAGVMLTHAGASPAAALPVSQATLAEFDHRALIEAADAELAKRPLADLKAEYRRLTGGDYDEDVAYFLAVDGPDDPRYRDLLRVLALDRRDPAFGMLWETFFCRNERGISQDVYASVLAHFLETWSVGAPVAQRVVVSGHIPVAGGYQIVAGRQLRLASRAHAHPDHAGLYLLLDCAAPIQSPEELVGHLGSVFEP